MHFRVYWSFLALQVYCLAVNAQSAVETASFPGARGDQFAYIEQVSATLRKPAALATQMPAIVILPAVGELMDVARSMRMR